MTEAPSCPQAEVEPLQRMFDKFINKMLGFKKDNCNELVPVPEYSGIISLCKLYSVLATPENGVSKAGRATQGARGAPTVPATLSTLFSLCFQNIGSTHTHKRTHTNCCMKQWGQQSSLCQDAPLKTYTPHNRSRIRKFVKKRYGPWRRDKDSEWAMRSEREGAEQERRGKRNNQLEERDLESWGGRWVFLSSLRHLATPVDEVRRCYILGARHVELPIN